MYFSHSSSFQIIIVIHFLFHGSLHCLSLRHPVPVSVPVALLHSSLTSLVGTDHGHFEITGRQDVKYAVVLALAPVFASLFRSKLVDRRL
jgi:hypothetical protein